MRRLWPVLVLLLAGCERSFDDRYAKTQQQLQARQQQFDQQMERAAKQEPGQSQQH